MNKARSLLFCFASLLMFSQCSDDPVGPSFPQTLPKVGNTYVFEILKQGFQSPGTMSYTVTDVNASINGVSGLTLLEDGGSTFYFKCLQDGDVMWFDGFWIKLPFGTRRVTDTLRSDSTRMNGGKRERFVNMAVATPMREEAISVDGKVQKGYAVNVTQIFDYYVDDKQLWHYVSDFMHVWSHEIGMFTLQITRGGNGTILKSFKIDGQ